MSTKHFGYYDAWKTEILTCPICGWSGTFEQGAVEYYHDFMDSSCPVMDCPDAPILVIVAYPTTEETEQNVYPLSDLDRAGFASCKTFLPGFETSKLKSHEQLPDLSVSLSC